MSKNDQKTSKAQMVVLLILAVITVCGFGSIIYQYFDKGYDFGVVDVTRFNTLSYESATRELSETGVDFSVSLGAGYYTVGVHIPEGRYSVFMKSGKAHVIFDDKENGIYADGIITGDEREDGYDYIENDMNDIRLYKGAFIRIYTSEPILFTTTNAQMPLEYIENPNTESKTFSKTFIVGEDIAAGIYDVECAEGSGDIIIDWNDSKNISDGEFDIIGMNESEIFHNVVLIEGTKVELDKGMSVKFVPCERIASENYNDFYENY